jgi:integrase/recombinase XerD
MDEINVKDLVVNETGDIVKKKKHSVKHSKENALEENEKIDLLRAVKDLKDAKSETKERYEVLIHLMMNAGLRISEALQVRESWFKEVEEGMLLNIPSKDRDLFNMKRDWSPKTLAGKREVFFLDKGVGEKVRSYFIHCGKIGFSRQRAAQIIKMLGIKINKPGLHPHALRSTYANMLVYQGVNMITLCYYMGWNNMNTAIAYVKTSNVAARKDLIKKFSDN